MSLDPVLLADTRAWLVDEVTPLSEYAWAYRYPNPLAAPDRAEADQAREIAIRATAPILSRLPPETHP